MLHFKLLPFVALLAGSAVYSAHIPQYKGYKLYEVTVENNDQWKALFEISQKSENFDFWNLARSLDSPSRIMVAPEQVSSLEETLTNAGLSYNLVESDVSKILRESESSHISSRMATYGSLDFTRYYRHSEINDYLDYLGKTYPKIAAVTTVGYSYERRPMKAITITNGDGKRNKKVIFIDAGIHAREWLAPATALYIIHQLVENFENNKHLLENFHWIILPVVNPDGYEYTHTYYRYWRKTRKPNKVCEGTDGNRNFDFHWAEVGTSYSPCHDTYHGSKPFSEPETKVVRDILLSLKGRGVMYLSFHSYGSYFLYPWGWTSSLPENWRDIHEVAKSGADAIYKATGEKYTIGSSTNVLYPAAGGSDDYAYAKAGFPVSMTVELPAGGKGFDPPPKVMTYRVQETWHGIRAMGEKVNEKYA